MEKRERYKKEKRKSFYKSIILIIGIIALFYGIKVVNQGIVYLGYLDNPTIINVNIKKRKIDLFGKSYSIDLRILKENK